MTLSIISIARTLRAMTRSVRAYREAVRSAMRARLAGASDSHTLRVACGSA